MTADSFEEGILLGMLLSRGSSGSAPEKPVIKPLTVTKNGTYTAPNGIDGYSPVSVGVDDRYDEGYQDGYDDGYSDGYDDAKDIYEKLIAQGNGDGETVEDDNGNVIDNAIVADDDSEINDILCGIVFPNGGGSVSVDGLTGADTYFRIDQVTTVNANGATSKQIRLSVVNKQTGETKVTASSVNHVQASGSTITWKIESVSFGGINNRTSVRVNVMPYVNGVAQPRFSAGLGGLASNVGGTSFGPIGSQTAITQQGA